MNVCRLYIGIVYSLYFSIACYSVFHDTFNLIKPYPWIVVCT